MWNGGILGMCLVRVSLFWRDTVFRGSVCYHHGQEHGTTQADMVREQPRVLYLDLSNKRLSTGCSLIIGDLKAFPHSDTLLGRPCFLILPFCMGQTFRHLGLLWGHAYLNHHRKGTHDDMDDTKIILVCFETVLLCITAWLRTWYVDQVNLSLDLVVITCHYFLNTGIKGLWPCWALTNQSF